VGALNGQGALVTGGSRGIRGRRPGARRQPRCDVRGHGGQDRAAAARPAGGYRGRGGVPGRPDSGWISGQNLAADGGLLP